MALTQFGGKTKTLFLNNVEEEKLHLAFEADVTIKAGQPVVLTIDGKIEPAAGDATDAALIIGYSIMNGAAGDEVTIAMRGYTTIFAMSDAAQPAGPVSYAGVNGTDGFYTNYAEVEAIDALANANGIALDAAAAANELIRVVLF